MTPHDEVLAEMRAHLKRTMVMSVHLGTIKGSVGRLNCAELAALDAIVTDYGRLWEFEKAVLELRMLEASEPMGTA